MFELNDKVIIVTGAASGIGKCIARMVARAGARTVATDIDTQKLEQTQADFHADGLALHTVAADCSQVASIQALVDRAVSRFGRLDAIVNNAGVTRPAYITDIREEDWDFINAINAKGVFFCMQAAARQMMAQGSGGSIINIASVGARGFAHASSVAYAASKGAVIGMTRLAAHQLGRHDIRVNAVCPGVTMTELALQTVAQRAADADLSVEDYQKNAPNIFPLGRPNDPDDMAAMAVFLASDAARNITGQAYNVDGGLVMS